MEDETSRKRPGKGLASRKVFPCAIYVRVTVWEKRQIAMQANAAALSLSRYLVRCGLQPGKAPPTAQERRRLERLALSFQQTSLSLTRLAARTSLLTAVGGGEETATEMRETARTLGALAREVLQRLSDT